MTTSLVTLGIHPVAAAYGGSSNFNASSASTQAILPYELYLPLVEH